MRYIPVWIWKSFSEQTVSSVLDWLLLKREWQLRFRRSGRGVQYWCLTLVVDYRARGVAELLSLWLSPSVWRKSLYQQITRPCQSKSLNAATVSTSSRNKTWSNMDIRPQDERVQTCSIQDDNYTSGWCVYILSPWLSMTNHDRT